MTLPALSPETAPPGTPLRPLAVTYTDADVLDFLAQTGEPAEGYRTADGRLRVPPAMLMAQPIRIVHASFHYETGVHTASHLTLHRLPLTGEPLTVTGRVRDFSERGGDRYVVLAVAIAAGDEVCAEIEHTSIYALRARR